MRHAIVAICFGSLVFADLRPRPSATDYPANERGPRATIGAFVLSQKEMKDALASDLRDFIVVEVGVYPAQGATLNLSSGDFGLKCGSDDIPIRPADPAAIAAANYRKASSSRRTGPVDVYPTGRVGYESGTIPDPVTGQPRRVGGVYGGGGVAVGPADSAPAPVPRGYDPDFVRDELEARSLPETSVDRPVAGYLFFRVPSKARASAMELQYFDGETRTRVALPPAKRK